MGNVKSCGVRIVSMSLISSVDTTFRKAKVERHPWIIYSPSVLGVISAWEVITQLMNGTSSSHRIRLGSVDFGVEKHGNYHDEYRK